MSKFTFSSATIGSTNIANSEFVYGFGEFHEEGWDAENTTANGIHHYDRITKEGRGQMVLYGNKVSLAEPTSYPSLSYIITLTSSNGTSISRTGVVILARYDDARQNTVIQFRTDPIPPST